MGWRLLSWKEEDDDDDDDDDDGEGDMVTKL